jgi:hypothetical protein
MLPLKMSLMALAQLLCHGKMQVILAEKGSRKEIALEN